MRRRDAEGPAPERRLEDPEPRSDPLPLAATGKRTRDGARSNTGALDAVPRERVVSVALDGTALRVGAGLALEEVVRRGAGVL